MTLWFLAFLAVAWIVVYLPSVWRARQKSPLPAVQRFKRRMRLISPRASMGLGAGRWIVVPGKREQLALKAFARAQQRRAFILAGLCVIALATGIWALVKGGAAIEVHLVADAAAAFYVALLLDAKRRRAERIQKVRALAQREGKHAPAYEGESAFQVVEASGSGRS